MDVRNISHSHLVPHPVAAARPGPAPGAPPTAGAAPGAAPPTAPAGGGAGGEAQPPGERHGHGHPYFLTTEDWRLHSDGAGD